MSHKELILSHLMEGKSITPLEALDLFKCFRLGARIWDLKKEGHDIKSELFFDERSGKHYERYWIEKEPEPVKEPEIDLTIFSPRLFTDLQQLEMQFTLSE